MQEDDGKAAYLLISFIHDDLLDLVRDKQTSKEICKSLEIVHANVPSRRKRSLGSNL